MAERGNEPDLKYGRIITNDDFFRMFDALPREIRLFMDHAPYPTDPKAPLDLLRRGWPVNKVLQRIKDTYAMAGPIEVQRVYGPTHPQAKPFKS